MILAHGTVLPDADLPALLDSLEDELNATRANLTLEAETVVSAIDTLGRRLDSGALDHLIARFAAPNMLDSLAQIRPALCREALEDKLKTELGPEVLSPRPRPFGRARYLPLGVLFHVTAGNVAGLPAFSAVEGLLTGNINLLKLPREDKGLTLAILSQLTDQEPRLAPFLYAFDVPSSDTATLKRLAALADGLVVWGGDEAVRACRGLAPPGCKLTEWAHRLSFAYVAGYEDREAELTALARHIVRTGGLLCSSCQVIYLDTEDWDRAQAFCRDFLPILEGAAREGRSPGQAAEATLYSYETLLEQAVDRRDFDDRFFPGRGCSITLRRGQELELSHLHGNVLVKCLPRRELLPVLRRQKGCLQTAGLLCARWDREALSAILARAGVTRITRAGHMSHTFPGEGHDGEYPLRRYVRAVDTED